MTQEITAADDSAVKTGTAHTAVPAGVAPPLQRAARAWRSLWQLEGLNFLLTNRIPRIAATRLVGRLSRIESPVFARLAIAVWGLFTPLDFSDAPPQRWRSLRDCFTRPLRPGARTVDADPAVLASPSDGIVGACGPVVAGQVYQAKGYPYRTDELFGPTQDASVFEGGTYVTLRLTSAMYHRFHAPADLRLQHVTYLSGDAWNVNPVALKRVQRLYCRNERAVLRAALRDGRDTPIAIVPVAAVLVASIRLLALDVTLHLRWPGPNEMPCDALASKGQELGWFEHGSTILVFVPPGFELAPGIAPGSRIQMGQALLRSASI